MCTCIFECFDCVFSGGLLQDVTRDNCLYMYETVFNK